MIVIFKSERVLSGPIQKKNTKGQLVKAGNFILLPGSNFIDDAEWKIMEKMKSIKSKIDKDVISVVENKETKKPASIQEIAKNSPEQATKLINDCGNRNTLELWKKELVDFADLRYKCIAKIEEISGPEKN